MRDLHERMLAAVLDGDGLDGVARVAAHELGDPVAILLPARGLAGAWPERPAAALGALIGWAAEAVAARDPAHPPPADLGVELAVPVSAEGDPIGFAATLARDPGDGDPALLVDREGVLRAAAVAALSEVAVVEARDQVAEQLRGSFIEDMRAGALDRLEITRRGNRLGCDLGAGAVAIAAAGGGRPRYVAALIASSCSGAVAEPIDARVYGLIPARTEGATEIGEATIAAARAVIRRLGARGPASCSSFYADPGDLGRALEEAELVLDVTSRDPRLAEQLGGGVPGGVYRLLFRALASNPGEVRSFYEDTVAPVVGHDRSYRTDLLGTLEAYLAHDCNMRATAEAVYAHRHTIAHRLERICELTGLDPSSGADRERLGLGIKAYRLIEPTLPR